MPSYFGLFDEIMSHSDKEQPVFGKNFSYELPKNYQGIYDAKVHGTRIPWMLRKVEILQRIPERNKKTAKKAIVVVNLQFASMYEISASLFNNALSFLFCNIEKVHWISL